MKAKNLKNFEKIVITEWHDYSKSLWTTEGFTINNEKYKLSPGFINKPDGTIEIIELSFIKI